MNGGMWKVRWLNCWKLGEKVWDEKVDLFGGGGWDLFLGEVYLRV